MMNLKIIIPVIILTVILLISYYFFNKDSGHNIIHDKIEYFYDSKQIIKSSDNFKESLTGIKYTLSFWIRTDNVPLNAHWKNSYIEPKTVLFRDGSPNVMLTLPNTLNIQIGYKNTDGILDFYSFDFENFESQKWCNFVITVNNRKVEIYNNSVLVKSKILPNVPWFSKKNLNIGETNNNFNGYVGLIDYFNYNLDRKHILKLYNKNLSKIPNYLENYKQNLENDEKLSSMLKIINK